MKNNIMEIDIKAFEHNINEIKKYVGEDKKIMPVIKANAYGTYINQNISVIDKFDIVAVANVYEAEEIRKIGYTKKIFILNQPDILCLGDINKTNSIIGLSSFEFLEEVINKRIKIKAHLEIETGMGRTGIYLKDLEKFIRVIKSTDLIDVQGIYTHFAIADEDHNFTDKQIEKFKKAVDIVKSAFGNTIKYVHCQASNGILNEKVDFCNLVRPGIIMYGYESFPGASKKINLYPVTKLKSRINFIKLIEPGESISYSRKFIAQKEMKVATVPLGYADGIRRNLFGKGEVIINGKIVPIIGVICMDSFMVDVSNVENVKVGDEVYIWDNENVSVDSIANKCNTTNYEIISTISNRVERVFV